MANYVINEVGSRTKNIPSKLSKGDTLRFNITNNSTTNPYLGYFIDYEIPADCTLKIEAYGARGSYGNLYTYGLTSSTRSGNGAYIYGTFTFNGGDKLLMAVGQHGKDAMTSTSSTSDLTTGAGGGATTIAKKVSSSSYQFVGSSNNDSTQYAGWYLEPLIIAAGGNGSRDNGYSGTGTIYGGQADTTDAESIGTTNTSGTGATFSKEVGSVSENSSSYGYGRSFLNGNLGSMYYYSRSSTYALAGFGGGGSNLDDGNGGGGGGWIAGYRGSAAKSYRKSGIVGGSESDYNAGDGYIVMTVMDIKTLNSYIKVNNIWKEVDSAYTKVNGIWREIDSLTPKVNGVWK